MVADEGGPFALALRGEWSTAAWLQGPTMGPMSLPELLDFLSLDHFGGEQELGLFLAQEVDHTNI